MYANRFKRKSSLVVGLAVLALLAIFIRQVKAQQSALPQRLSFSVAEKDAYLDSLVRNAPSDWSHGKNWVLIQPYLVGRNVTQPISRTVCPDAGLASTPVNGEIPQWIYSAPGICEELAMSHDAALVVLEDPMDTAAAYFMFIACDMKRRRRDPCDMDGYFQQDGMKLEESNKHGRSEFDLLIPTLDGKIARYLIPEIWHMRDAEAKPDAQ